MIESVKISERGYTAPKFAFCGLFVVVKRKGVKVVLKRQNLKSVLLSLNSYGV